MSDVDLDSFPLAVKGHKFQDFVEGEEFVHHWGRTLTRGDNVLFSTATCNWNPMHLNAEFARAHGHPDMVMNPMLVLCTVVGLSVEDLSETGGPFLGMEDVVFHIPVHPDDTLTACSTVVSTVVSASRPKEGIVTWRTEAHNQHGRTVLSYRRTNLVAKRSEA
jgi:itaconyl-CoA hydratase